MILKIEVQGGMIVKQKAPDAVLVFLQPPSLDELERRLRHRRTDSDDQIAKRLLHARKEMDYRSHYDYAVTNDVVPEAVDAIRAILRAEHCRIRKGGRMADHAHAKRVVLGVSASIAAYKAADLASQLVKSGIEVFPVMTADAARFVQPATFRALTHHPCPIDVFEEPFPGEIAHIWLARNCDLFAIVPASMNVIARLANGLAEDMLTAAAMACTAPILLAPGMNTGMWNNPATQANLGRLRDYGYYFIEPTTGRLACRTEGVGRMADVATIFAAIQEMLARQDSWRGVRILVTAGPTREALDPVRFLSNRSSGRMGYAAGRSRPRARRDRHAGLRPHGFDPTRRVGVHFRGDSGPDA